jgi:hypothetical protein
VGNVVVDDFLVAEVERGHGEGESCADKSETPERDVSDEFVGEVVGEEGDCCVGSLFSEEKTLEFEDEEVEDIGEFTEKNVKRVLVDLVISRGSQTTIASAHPIRDAIEGDVKVPDDASAGDELGSSFDGCSGSETEPQNTKDETGEIDKLRRENSRDDKEKANGTCTRKFPGHGVVHCHHQQNCGDDDVPTE